MRIDAGPGKIQAQPGVGLKNAFLFSWVLSKHSSPENDQCERQSLIYCKIFELVPATVMLKPSFPTLIFPPKHKFSVRLEWKVARSDMDWGERRVREGGAAK